MVERNDKNIQAQKDIFIMNYLCANSVLFIITLWSLVSSRIEEIAVQMLTFQLLFSNMSYARLYK